MSSVGLVPETAEQEITIKMLEYCDMLSGYSSVSAVAVTALCALKTIRSIIAGILIAFKLI